LVYLVSHQLQRYQNEDLSRAYLYTYQYRGGRGAENDFKRTKLEAYGLPGVA